MRDFPGQRGEADTAPQALAERLHGICSREPRPNPEIVEDVVDGVLTTMVGRLTHTEMSLLKVVGELGRIIAETKAEISEISVAAITESHIPVATDELDAIIAHTAQATDCILESCEMLDQMAYVLDGEHADILRQATTQIYEACGFQDITGQRITKIVKALKMIEAKVLEISGSGDLLASHRKQPHGVEKTMIGPDTDLLNGPGLPHLAADQAHIDKLLAEFD